MAPSGLPVRSKCQIGNALAAGLADIDGVGEAADTHHVAALLIIRVGMEEIVGDVLEDFLQAARPSSSCDRHSDR